MTPSGSAGRCNTLGRRRVRYSTIPFTILYTSPIMIVAPVLRSRCAARLSSTLFARSPVASRVPAPSSHRSLSSTRKQLKPSVAPSTSNPTSTPPPPTSSSSSSFSHSALPHVSTDDKVARVTWASGIESRYHHMWLRDHCRCPECYHPKTKQRLLNTFAIPPDVHPLATEATTEGLRVTWPPLRSEPSPDGHAEQSATSTPADIFESPESQPHASLYPWKWLRTNSYAPPLDQPQLNSMSGQDDFIGLGKTLWGKGIESHPPTVPYEEIMAGDEGVWKWCEKIVSNGAVCLRPPFVC